MALALLCTSTHVEAQLGHQGMVQRQSLQLLLLMKGSHQQPAATGVCTVCDMSLALTEAAHAAPVPPHLHVVSSHHLQSQLSHLHPSLQQQQQPQHP